MLHSAKKRYMYWGTLPKSAGDDYVIFLLQQLQSFMTKRVFYSLKYTIVVPFF